MITFHNIGSSPDSDSWTSGEFAFGGIQSNSTYVFKVGTGGHETIASAVAAANYGDKKNCIIVLPYGHSETIDSPISIENSTWIVGAGNNVLTTALVGSIPFVFSGSAMTVVVENVTINHATGVDLFGTDDSGGSCAELFIKRVIAIVGGEDCLETTAVFSEATSSGISYIYMNDSTVRSLGESSHQFLPGGINVGTSVFRADKLILDGKFKEPSSFLSTGMENHWSWAVNVSLLNGADIKVGSSSTRAFVALQEIGADSFLEVV